MSLRFKKIAIAFGAVLFLFLAYTASDIPLVYFDPAPSKIDDIIKEMEILHLKGSEKADYLDRHHDHIVQRWIISTLHYQPSHDVDSTVNQIYDKYLEYIIPSAVYKNEKNPTIYKQYIKEIWIPFLNAEAELRQKQKESFRNDVFSVAGCILGIMTGWFILEYATNVLVGRRIPNLSTVQKTIECITVFLLLVTATRCLIYLNSFENPLSLFCWMSCFLLSGYIIKKYWPKQINSISSSD